MDPIKEEERYKFYDEKLKLIFDENFHFLQKCKEEMEKMDLDLNFFQYMLRDFKVFPFCTSISYSDQVSINFKFNGNCLYINGNFIQDLDLEEKFISHCLLKDFFSWVLHNQRVILQKNNR